MKITCFCGEKLVYTFHATEDEFQVQPCQKCVEDGIRKMYEEALKIIGGEKNE